MTEANKAEAKKPAAKGHTITFLRGYFTSDGKVMKGEQMEVDRKTADKLIKAGIAQLELPPEDD